MTYIVSKEQSQWCVYVHKQDWWAGKSLKPWDESVNPIKHRSQLWVKYLGVKTQTPVSDPGLQLDLDSEP